jgi:hypothetical protein
MIHSFTVTFGAKYLAGMPVTSEPKAPPHGHRSRGVVRGENDEQKSR